MVMIDARTCSPLAIAVRRVVRAVAPCTDQGEGDDAGERPEGEVCGHAATEAAA